MTGKLDGRIAIVTGSDSGIGQATAVAFAREGADVVVTYFRDRDGSEETRRQVESAGRRALLLPLDQRDPAQVARLFEATERELGTPFILVNNAGKDSTGTQVADLPDEAWDDIIRSNLHGPFYCCRQFIRARRAAGGQGKIINVTSVHEEIPRAGSAAYNASKGGLRNLTRTLALELAPDRINVNNIAPGMILTPMNQAALDDPKLQAAQVQNIPLRRAGEPWEIARLAVYLASSDADYATGQSFTLDGGLVMNQGQGA
ncbi:SDR family oxidoreductase [Siccirubricoccus sp. KC 17139]|uniref:SDR family oxidoreductase n=1 Tax=Siccirubricoccus soli TaxID=2899147 RepID=A0ABT1D4Q5_9PROT|nr:SDR family oxidoreductase [Siccirubricoccus soli]MCO6415965.1 SDR family oxidoreductase [Siccirubricoccus soli]MCP2682097.1 SDR family oxidoreductase [Siccirubricoccus soli]